MTRERCRVTRPTTRTETEAVVLAILPSTLPPRLPSPPPLPGKFEQAITQLNGRLSQLLTEDHPERETWRQVALNFKNQYMNDASRGREEQGNQTLKAKVRFRVRAS